MEAHPENMTGRPRKLAVILLFWLLSAVTAVADPGTPQIRVHQLDPEVNVESLKGPGVEVVPPSKDDLRAASKPDKTVLPAVSQREQWPTA